jgi:hypothetical protein
VRLPTACRNYYSPQHNNAYHFFNLRRASDRTCGTAGYLVPFPVTIPRQANEIPALAAGLGPKWRQYFFLVLSAYRFHGRLRQIKIDWSLHCSWQRGL